MQPNDPQAQRYPAPGHAAHGDQPAYGQTSPVPYGATSPAPYIQGSPVHGPTAASPYGQAPYASQYGQQAVPQGQTPPTPYGQAPYASPQYGQQPPPYTPTPPPYLQQTDAARVIKQQKGKRDVIFGVIWLMVGLLITGITMSSDSPVYIVAWGPMLYGLYKIVKGVIAISSNNG
jgi:hypothetical protein